MVEVIPVILSFLWAFYWPLLYIRVRSLFARYDLTRRKLAACIILAAVPTAVNAIFNLAFYGAYASLALLMILSAIVPILLLIVYGRTTKRRTHIKLLILAVYFHIFWQMLAGGIFPIVIDLIITAVLILLSKIKRRKHKLQDTLIAHGSISELWK